MRRKESREKAKPATKAANKRPVSRVSERAPERAMRVRKNMDMDQAKLDAARRFFGARTETEAVDAALDLAAFQAEIATAIDKMVKAGGVTGVFGD
jgi:hypothetical protein